MSQFFCSMTLSKSERQIAAAVPAASICRSFSAEASKRIFPEAENSSSGSHKLNFIGMWGRKHLRYIKEHRPALYTDLQTSGKLSSYLAEVDNRAKEMLDLLVKQMAEKQGITEQLKAQDQMAWVRRMNNIHNAAEEIINAEVIFA